MRHLSSTNLIENLIGSVRKLSARVQNWRWTDGSALDLCDGDGCIQAIPATQRIPRSSFTPSKPCVTTIIT